MACITYLCQSHHNPEISDDVLRNDLLLGAYRFDDFAASTWFELIEDFVRLTPAQTPSQELIDLLEVFVDRRTNEGYKNPSNNFTHLSFAYSKLFPQNVYDMLCRVSQFRRASSGSDSNKHKGEFHELSKLFRSIYLICGRHTLDRSRPFDNIGYLRPDFFAI